MGAPSGRRRFMVMTVVPSPSAARSASVKTPSTPGMAAATALSIDRMRAWAWGERSSTAWAWPGKATSWMKLPWPWTSFGSSNRETAWPMPKSPIDGLRLLSRRRRRPAPRRREGSRCMAGPRVGWSEFQGNPPGFRAEKSLGAASGGRAVGTGRLLFVDRLAGRLVEALEPDVVAPEAAQVVENLAAAVIGQGDSVADVLPQHQLAVAGEI